MGVAIGQGVHDVPAEAEDPRDVIACIIAERVAPAR
jgi:hypothetical protein